MKLHELKASDLKALKVDFSNPELPAVNTKQQSYNEGQMIYIEHRGLHYRLGRWDQWNGPYFMVADSTGLIYRGTFADVKSFLVLCSAAHHEPHVIK